MRWKNEGMCNERKVSICQVLFRMIKLRMTGGICNAHAEDEKFIYNLERGRGGEVDLGTPRRR